MGAIIGVKEGAGNYSQLKRGRSYGRGCPTIGVSPWRRRRGARWPRHSDARGVGGVRLVRVKEEEEARVGRMGRKAKQAGGVVGSTGPKARIFFLLE
jgi:hypothetical protein